MGCVKFADKKRYVTLEWPHIGATDFYVIDVTNSEHSEFSFEHSYTTHNTILHKQLPS